MMLYVLQICIFYFFLRKHFWAVKMLSCRILKNANFSPGGTLLFEQIFEIHITLFKIIVFFFFSKEILHV